MLPTGDTAQTDTAHCTLDIPCTDDDISDDFVLAAIRGSLIALCTPDAWDDTGHTITADQAAAYAQAAYDSFTVT